MFADSAPLLEAIVLGIIQGFTEFLPISSSAHLMLLPKLANFPYFGKTFDVILHGGTLLAVCFYKWDLIKKMLVSLSRYGQACYKQGKILSWTDYGNSYLKLAWLIIVATVPVAALGFLLENMVEHFFHGLLCTAFALAGFGFLLYKSDSKGGCSRELDSIGIKEMLYVGIAQSLALFPGVSRSGAILTAARFLNIRRSEAGLISLVTALPVVGGAFFVKIVRCFNTTISPDPTFLWTASVGFLASFIAGLVGIMLLEKVVAQYTLKPFAIYRIALALILLVVWIA